MNARIVRRAAAVALATATAAGLSVCSTSVSAAAAVPVQTDVHTVVVNFGTHVDPAQAAAAAGVLDGLDNSGYLRGLAAEYALSSRAGYLGAGLIPDANLPSTTDDSSIDSALAARISAGALSAPQGATNYVVLLPPGVTPANSSTGGTQPFCSSHHAFNAGAKRAYVIVIADYTDNAQQCGGARDAAAAASVNVSRQLVNAITDPAGDGTGLQQSGTGAEIGDACAVTSLTGNVDGYPVQPWWSNAGGSCTFGVTGVGVTADVGTTTNARVATFRLHDTATTSAPPSFTCTLDDATEACDTSHPLALTGIAAGSHVLDASVKGLGDATFSWLVDVTAPVATLLSPTAAVTVGKTVSVSFSGTDAGGAGVAAYDVRYRTAAWNGGFARWVQPPAWQGTAGRRVVMAVQPGHAYCFGVRAHDRADNVSASWSAPRCTTIPVDDRTMTAGAGWHRIKAATAYRGTLSVATANGARLQLANARFRQVALIVRTCPSCGRIDVYRGRVLWRTVNTHRAATHNRIVIKLPAISLRTSTISLRVAGSGKPVYVDGVAVLRT